MSEDKHDSMLGYDPLAWLKEEEEPAAAEAEAAAVPEPDPAAPVQDPPAPLQEAEKAEVPAGAAVAEAVASGEGAAAAADSGAAMTVKLDDSLNIAEVGALHGVLKEALAGGQSVVLDGSSVERVDGASLQVLAAFVREADGTGLAVQWCGVSDSLLQGADLLGLGGLLWGGGRPEAA